MTYEEAGLATTLVGLVKAHEMLGREIEMIREKLQLAQNGGNARAYLDIRRSDGAKGPWASMTPEERSAEMKRRMAKRGNPKVVVRKSNATKLKGYWARMSKEERAAEMQRRILVHQGKAPSAKIEKDDVEKLHPRDKRSPRHVAWIKRMRKASKASWANLTPEARAARLAKTGVTRLNGAAV